MSSSMFGGLGNKIKNIDPLRGGDVILEGAGLPTLTGQGDKNVLDMGQAAAAAAAKAAAEAAQKIQLDTLASQKQAADSMANIQKNFGTDLTNENKAQVIAGGTADAVSADSDLKRKRQGTGLASALGINTQ